MLFLAQSFSINLPQKEQLARLRRAQLRLYLAMRKSDEKQIDDENDADEKRFVSPPDNADTDGGEEQRTKKKSESLKSREQEDAEGYKEPTKRNSHEKGENKDRSNVSPVLVLLERKQLSEAKDNLPSYVAARRFQKPEQKKKLPSNKEELTKKSDFTANAIAKPMQDEPSLKELKAKTEQAGKDEKETLKPKVRAKQTSERKLDKLVQKIRASELSKRQSKKKKDKVEKDKKSMKKNIERKISKDKKNKPLKKSEVKNAKEEPKKTLADRLFDQFNTVKSLFGGAKAGKAQKNAEAKLSKKNTRLGIVADGDDALPQLGVKEHGGYDDCWIEDPAVMTDKSHRPDLVLVENFSNGGQLWHENKRPFWRNKLLQREIPPISPGKTVSKMLLDVISKKVPISDPAPDPAPYQTENLTLDEMKVKDEVWFTEDVVLGNTIRSIIGAIFDESEKANQPMESIGNFKCTFKEPISQVAYYRHDNTKREIQKFTKSAPGKPRKLKKGSTAPSSSASSSSTTNPNEKTAGDSKRKKKEPSIPSTKDKKKQPKK